MINRIKGIKASLNYSTLNELEEMMEELKEDLSMLDQCKYGKLYSIIDKNDIINMKYGYIPTYLDKLITIIEYIES